MRSSPAWILTTLLAGCQQLFGLDAPALHDASADTMRGDVLVDMALDDAPMDTVPAPTLLFVTDVTSTIDASSYNYGAQPIGSPAADRYVIVVAHGRSPAGGYFSSAQLMIGSTAATRVIESGVAAAVTSIFIAAIPTGTTATFTLAYSGGISDRRSALAIYAAYGILSTMPAYTATFDVADTNPGLVTIDVPARGVAVTGVSMSSVPGGTTSSWTGLVERYNVNVETSAFAGGSAIGGAMQTQMHSHLSTDSTTTQHIASASFR